MVANIGFQIFAIVDDRLQRENTVQAEQIAEQQSSQYNQNREEPTREKPETRAILRLSVQFAVVLRHRHFQSCTPMPVRGRVHSDPNLGVPIRPGQ
ncbi:MAG: hypothetical protein MnENMB40S_05510 [Rhizobiaceae bacterium MnEN-MB40S]|nr:MAG: hypothetical protein MnENMB40S_05510 [Rhizobiaceae bacterium MnEN-MB40S]